MSLVCNRAGSLAYSSSRGSGTLPALEQICAGSRFLVVLLLISMLLFLHVRSRSVYVYYWVLHAVHLRRCGTYHILCWLTLCCAMVCWLCFYSMCMNVGQGFKP
jgi:hypothetical protein